MNNTTTDDVNMNLINTLRSTTTYLMIYGGIFVLTTGNLGCLGNIVVFRSQAYRQQACFLYLFYQTIASVFILNIILITRIIESGFKIPVMDGYDVICRIREFISLFMYQNENTLFLFASIDRILSIQRSNILRQWSNRVSLAHKVILASGIFWILLTGHRLIFYTNAGGRCWSMEGTYRVFDTYLDLSLSGIGSPLLVIVLAIALWINVRRFSKQHPPRNAVTLATQTGNQQAEFQLAIMLLLQSILAIINYVPFGVFVLYRMFTNQGLNESPLRIAWEGIAIALIRLSSYLFAAGTFYISFTSNRSFRQQFKSSLGMKNAAVNSGLVRKTVTRPTAPTQP